MRSKKIKNITALSIALLILSVGCTSGSINNDIPKQKNPGIETNTPAETNESKTDADKKTKTSNQKTSDISSKLNLKKVTVSRVVDGDTVELSDGSKVRLIGVNTPESTTRTEPYGKEASNYTKKQLTGKTVYLEKDVSETDNYGRLLRYIWLSIPEKINDSEIRSKMYNAELLLNGYAQVSTYPPDVKYQEYFTKYNSEARNANKGLWAINKSGTTKGDTSESTEKSGSSSSKQGRIKGNINSKGEKIYHVPGGKYYNQTVPEQWFNTEEEAKAAGYRKSKL